LSRGNGRFDERVLSGEVPHGLLDVTELLTEEVHLVEPPIHGGELAIKASSLCSVSASLSTGWAFLGGIIAGTQYQNSHLMSQ